MVSSRLKASTKEVEVEKGLQFTDGEGHEKIKGATRIANPRAEAVGCQGGTVK